VADAEDGGGDHGAPPTHFTYALEKDYLADELCQGDVLRRTDELDLLLKEVHPHFFGHSKNLYFIVLTQSCDLVVRGEGIKAPYISIAPVRLVDDVVARQLAALSKQSVRAKLPVLTHKAKAKLADFVRSLLNNNASGYFYLESSGTQLGADCCAFLRLSIPIKTDLHYDKCLRAKFLQLNDTFQAKFGFLIGNQYSRVGTKDWDAANLKSKADSLLKNAALYVADEMFSAVEELYQEKLAADNGYELTEEDIRLKLRSIPSTKKQVLARTKSILEGLGVGDELIQRFERRAQSDQEINRLLR
jgi:hypothetical protein